MGYQAVKLLDREIDLLSRAAERAYADRERSVSLQLEAWKIRLQTMRKAEMEEMKREAFAVQRVQPEERPVADRVRIAR